MTARYYDFDYNVTTQIWKNANRVEYNPKEITYSFYVDGKLIQLDDDQMCNITLIEVGAPEPELPDDQIDYAGKLCNLSLLGGKDPVKEWTNVEIISTVPGKILFRFEGTEQAIFPSDNDTVIISVVR